MKRNPHVSTSFMLIAIVCAIAFPHMSLAQTGDPLVDSWIAPHTRKGGNTSVPLLLNPAGYPDITGCNSGIGPSWETNCPSDLTFTPNANTGGYQAFGVGISSYPASEYWDYGCYLQWQFVWHNDSGWQEELVLVCDYQLISLPAYAVGEAGGRLRWGASQFYYGFPAGNWTLSTLAFKGSSFPACTPEFWGTSAACGFGLPSSVNVTYVPGAGYEAKILIPDSDCSPFLGYRTGGFNDVNAGCFATYVGTWSSDLPDPYLDTTFLDSAAFFVPGIGTQTASAIIEGATYFWRTSFSQFGTEAIAFGQIQHKGAVTVRYPLAPTCLYPQTGVAGTYIPPNAGCWFNVDQTNVSLPAGLF